MMLGVQILVKGIMLSRQGLCIIKDALQELAMLMILQKSRLYRYVQLARHVRLVLV